MKTELTFLGVVRRVIGSKVFVEISSDIPSANPIINGRIYRLGQIGSFVRIPLGFINVYGIISMVGASEMKSNLSEDFLEFSGRQGQRWLEIQLVGECYGGDEFQRGVSVFPTIEDEVHIVTEEDLQVIYSSNAPQMVEIGHHVSSDNLKATIDLDKLVTRHAAIVGSTGSGKSNTVAAILKNLSDDSKYPSARVVIIDLHGEYGETFSETSKVFRINAPNNPLYVPYWALSFDELGSILFDRHGSSESQQDASIRGKIFDYKQRSCSELSAGVLEETDITVDSPVPFDIRELFFELYEAEYATLNEKENWGKIAYKTDEAGNEMRGNRDNLILPQYQPAAAGNAAPFLSNKRMMLNSYLNKMYSRLKDRRYNFLLSVGEYDGKIKDLHDLVMDWICHDQPITVFDLGGVPFEIVDLVVGVINRIIFEVMFWGRELEGVGRNRPLLIVFEEAHAYLPRSGKSQYISGYASNAVRRIFKEGRKYGVGSIVVSQRPSELDETILSQCGTFFALRLSNNEDQGRVRSAVPDTLSGLTELLPALRIGEAIVLGEAMLIPSRVRLPVIEPRPKSDDPKVSVQWSEEKSSSTLYAEAVTCWRTQGGSGKTTMSVKEVKTE